MCPRLCRKSVRRQVALGLESLRCGHSRWASRSPSAPARRAPPPVTAIRVLEVGGIRPVVNAVALSPDGGTVVVGDLDGDLVAREMPSGAERWKTRVRPRGRGAHRRRVLLSRRLPHRDDRTRCPRHRAVGRGDGARPRRGRRRRRPRCRLSSERADARGRGLVHRCTWWTWTAARSRAPCPTRTKAIPSTPWPSPPMGRRWPRSRTRAPSSCGAGPPSSCAPR